MFHPLIAQTLTDASEIRTVGEIGVIVLTAGKLLDLYNNFKEGRDRKKHTEEFIKQTERLQNIDSHLTTIKENQNKDTQTIALGSQRQGDMKITLDRVDRNVIQLKALSGIPDTETTQLHKTDVKPHQ